MNDPVRCDWCGNNPLYQHYHDTEWGVPIYDDRRLFEMLNLEGAQAGLSWITVLRKRENYRRAFDQFDADKMARYDEDKVSALLADPGIIRNQLKINAFINNAKLWVQMQRNGESLSDYLWSFVDSTPVINYYRRQQDVPATTAVSGVMSENLKKRGFKFVGSTVCYAFMQASGMVNDHLVTCFRHAEVGFPNRNKL